MDGLGESKALIGGRETTGRDGKHFGGNAVSLGKNFQCLLE